MNRLRTLIFAAIGGAFSFAANAQDVSVSIETVSDVIEGSGVSAVAFVIRKQGDIDRNASIQYRTLDGTATGGDGSAGCNGWPTDYLTTSDGLNIPPGRSESEIFVDFCGDDVYEDNECFTVELFDPGIGTRIAGSTAEACIMNDEDPPQLSIGRVREDEGDSGVTVFSVPFELNRAAQPAATFSYALSDREARGGTACADETDVDYVTSQGSLTIPGGTTETALEVSVCGDTRVEPDERLRLRLSNPVDVSFSRTARNVRIMNDDQFPPPVLSRLEPASAQVLLGELSPIRVRLVGQNFVEQSEVLFNGEPVNPQTVSFQEQTLGQERELVLSRVGLSPGSYAISVRNPSPGGGTSAPQTFTMAPAPAPVSTTPEVVKTIEAPVVAPTVTTTEPTKTVLAVVKASSPTQLVLGSGQRGIATLSGSRLELLTHAELHIRGKQTGHRVLLGTNTSKGRQVAVYMSRFVGRGTYEVVAFQERTAIKTPLTVVVK